MAKTPRKLKQVETLTHGEASRRNIPTAEYQSVMAQDDQHPIEVAWKRRNRDCDPQLVWRGKDIEDWSDLVAQAPPLFIQEKVHPKALIDDLRRHGGAPRGGQPDLFADFNGLPDGDARTEFYRHDANWSNRMILGDSLQVMASLAEREGLRGKVQCIYVDPPYGIRFNSNFQWSTTSRDVKDGKAEHITREPEQVKAFRDTWRDGIHSYLTYLRDRLTVARDLLTDSGSVFVQIAHVRVAAANPLTSQSSSSTTIFQYPFQGATFLPRKGGWKTNMSGMERLRKSGRLHGIGSTLRFVRPFSDFHVQSFSDTWDDTRQSGFGDAKQYIVQTATRVVERCILMTTDPGDLVLDPTCGSGTTACAAEEWGRRWITIDTSRVALARVMGARYPYYLLADSPEGQRKEAELAGTAPSEAPTHGDVRQGFVYERVPHVTLKSIANNAEIDVIWERHQESLEPLRREIDAAMGTAWEEWEIPRHAEDPWDEAASGLFARLSAERGKRPLDDARVARLLRDLNASLGRDYTLDTLPHRPADPWPEAPAALHARWWERRIARQREIDASIAAAADPEYLYDKPYEDARRVRVAGPFTVESLSPHRPAVDEEEEVRLGRAAERKPGYGSEHEFAGTILEHLRTAGVQQARKVDRIAFSALTPWPGELVCAEGRYVEGEGGGAEKRAGVLVGPEFGTVSRADLAAAAREAGDAGFDVLIACAFNYEARAADFTKLGRIPILKARMNADLHMADDLKNTGKGNLFVVFGEPDVDVRPEEGGDRLRVRIKGVDVFHPATGEIRSDGPDGIACWFLDTDYDEESFFVRHAYFLGANDPYKALKTTLRAEIDPDAWATLHGGTSRPFDRPASGRIAVKVINHLGDEVMKVFRV